MMLITERGVVPGHKAIYGDNKLLALVDDRETEWMLVQLFSRTCHKVVSEPRPGKIVPAGKVLAFEMAAV